MLRKICLSIILIITQEASPNQLNVGFLLNRISGQSTEPSFSIEQPHDIIKNWNKYYFGFEINKNVFTIDKDHIGVGFRIDYMPLSFIQKFSLSNMQDLENKLSIYQLQPAIYYERDLNSFFTFKFGGSILFNRYTLKSFYLWTNPGFMTDQTKTENIIHQAGCIFAEIKMNIYRNIYLPVGIRYSLKNQEIKTIRAQKDINPNDPIDDKYIYGFFKIDQIFPYFSICYNFGNL